MHHPTILITAGEPSGDRLGAALMAELKAQHKGIRFIGVGGDEMAKQGLASAFPMSNLAVMGLFEVIPSIPRILGHIKQLTQLAETEKPDLILTIDAQDFSARLAKALRSKALISSNPHTLIPHIHYVAPKVWAWRQGRAKKLPKLYTHMLTILPFEEKFFNNTECSSHAKRNTQNATRFATYIGHPATTALAPYSKHVTPNTSHITLALLPGSRMSELKRHWPLFLQTYRELKSELPNLQAILALPNEKTLQTCQQLAAWQPEESIAPVFGEARFQALANASAALTKSGTNNLELALLGTPAIVTYRMNPLTYLIAKWLVRVPYISLPNLILHKAGKRVAYPEYIQRAANPHKLATVLNVLLTGEAARHAQTQALQSFKKLMETPKPPATLAAEVINKYLKQNNL